MEVKKEINFSLKNTKMGNLCDGNVLISSELDEDITYLDLKEKLYLISNILNKCSEEVLLPFKDVDLYTLDDEELEEKAEQIIGTEYELLQEMIHLVVNNMSKTLNKKLGFEDEILEYSMQTFETLRDEMGNKYHNPRATFHSRGIKGLDPLQTSFIMGMDVVESMLYNHMNKNDIKKFIKKSFNLMVIDYITRIDEYDETESKNE